MAQVAFRKTVTLVAAAAALLAVGAPRPAFAQDSSAGPDLSTKKVTLNLENADIKFGLKLLFQAVGANYSIDQNVQGSVSVSLTDVSFRTALESMLRATSMRLTYRVESGVYIISPKQEEVTRESELGPEIEGPTTGKKPVYKIKLNFIDAIDLANAFGGGVIESRFSTQMNQGMGGGFGGGFGNGGFGNNGFGNSGFGNSGFGNGNVGNGSFGSGFGNGSFGNGSFGSGMGNGSSLGNGNRNRNGGGGNRFGR